MAGFCFMQPIIAMWVCWAWGMGPSFPQVHRVTSGKFLCFPEIQHPCNPGAIHPSEPWLDCHLGCLGWPCISHSLGLLDALLCAFCHLQSLWAFTTLSLPKHRAGSRA